MFYKIVHHLVAIYPANILIPADTRTRHGSLTNFKHISSNKDAYKFSFFPRTITQWNLLPSYVHEAGTVEVFKTLITVPVLVSVINH